MATATDFEPEFLSLYEAAQAFTLTSRERMYALYKAVEYITTHAIAGDVVECGVYRGGSTMLCASALRAMNETSRSLWLYDTFDGMPEPAAIDRDFQGVSAADQWQPQCYRCGLDEVQSNLTRTGYPPARLRFVEGRVEETIPGQVPDAIALLRLDTDWYASTRHELEHLFPRLVPGGVLIIDDYGHWQGCRKAVDEFLAEHRIPMLLSRIDYTGRIGVKPSC
jgi:O-methyltransferase